MPTELVDSRINEIGKKTGLKVSRNEGTFNLTFDIRNLRFANYRLSKENPNYEIIASCELLEGTSDKPSYFSGNTATQNRYSIFCKYRTKSLIPLFSIYENGLIGKIFKKEVINIKSIDPKFIEFLNGFPELNLLRNKISESAEISPAINHRKIKEKSEISILFQTYTIELELFESMINFVEKINTEYNLR